MQDGQGDRRGKWCRMDKSSVQHTTERPQLECEGTEVRCAVSGREGQCAGAISRLGRRGLRQWGTEPCVGHHSHYLASHPIALQHAGKVKVQEDNALYQEALSLQSVSQVFLYWKKSTDDQHDDWIFMVKVPLKMEV